VIKLHVVADVARFADHHAGAVVDEEMRADAGPRMDINARAAMRPFGHHARHHGAP
jgi:hypothetical protein